MRENPQPTNPTTLSRPQEPHVVATEADADFLRHSRALASQTVMTRVEVLQFTVGGDSAVSHW